eukprot:TRINITY_DN6798_c0_g2_i3.p1 TRINITY_DN6798_c0_g2~~TRINITY_DN6798_c0_g2_i3.p1  ORF type:complete len:137 (-),score=17.37 TRINITY_DN6798_c0_g2_i3:696-1106(-)
MVALGDFRRFPCLRVVALPMCSYSLEGLRGLVQSSKQLHLLRLRIPWGPPMYCATGLQHFALGYELLTKARAERGGDTEKLRVSEWWLESFMYDKQVEELRQEVTKKGASMAKSGIEILSEDEFDAVVAPFFQVLD